MNTQECITLEQVRAKISEAGLRMDRFLLATAHADSEAEYDEALDGAIKAGQDLTAWSKVRDSLMEQWVAA